MRQRRCRWSVYGAARLTALALSALLGCRGVSPEEVEVDVRNVGLDPQSGSAVVVLQARGDGPVLAIRIGQSEAQAIAMELYNVAAPRPLTHDLVKRILDTTGVVLRRVRITELRQETFFAALVLVRGGQEIEVDSRPSDAIALALRFACPILVNRALLESEVVQELGTGRQGIVAKIWGMTVRDLTPALAGSLAFEGTSRVAVSHVEPGTGGGSLRRGDVIVAVDSTPVGSVSALGVAAGAGNRSRSVEVWRDGGRLVLCADLGGCAGVTAPSAD
jgi:bifunctional DNase/RNase